MPPYQWAEFVVVDDLPLIRARSACTTMRQTRTFPWRPTRPGSNAGARGEQPSRTKTVAAVAAATVVAIAAAAFWIVATMVPATPAIRDGEADLAPQTPLTFSVWNLGGGVRQATLSEAIYDIDGKPGPAHEIPVQLVPVVGGSQPALWSEYRIERADGGPLLGFDGLYKLTLNATSAAGGLVGKGTDSHSYTFTTLASPRLRLPQGVVPLDYQKPVEMHWNHPIESFKVETVPAVEVRTWIDPNRKDVSYVDLVGAKPGTQYEVKAVQAKALNGGELVAPASLNVLTAAPPEVFLDKVKFEDGYRIVIPWDRPIKSLDYEISPSVQSTVQVGGSDPSVGYILLQNPKQGQEYAIKIKGALASTGFPLSGTRDLKVATPKPLKIDKFEPADQPKYGVPLDAGIDITFSEPVKDRTLVEKSIKIDPAVPGSFVWKAPNMVEFAPKGNLPGGTDFTVSVQGGRSGPFGADGGYLDDTAKLAFWTALDEEIEVNLTDQSLTLWEGGHPAWSTLVSTGVTGAETPTGLYKVEYKMDATRMVGTNPSGHHYDLPGVPWVMPFMGDYTLHGAYWRDTYGVPQSNGCVSMPVPAAKYLYDRTPVGTTIRIHY